DGTAVVGVGLDASGHEQAFEWANGVMTGLGFLSGGTSSRALATNGDGSVVVGASDHGAFLWDQVFRMQNLDDVLSSEYGLNLAGWEIDSATGVSTDGETIVGNGVDPTGHSQGFVALGLLVNRLVNESYVVAPGANDAIGMLGGSGVVQIGAG